MKEGQRLFTETVHAHDGNMSLLFVPDSTNPYRMNANFDGLSASYISGVREPDKNQWPNIHDAWKLFCIIGGNWS